MPTQDMNVPSLLGGVSTVSQNGRAPHETTAQENVELYPDRGCDKRPGTEIVLGEGPVGELDMDQVIPAADRLDAYILWINRGPDEQFLVIVDPNLDDDGIIQAFNLEDGTKVNVFDAIGNPLGDVASDNLRAYITAGAGTADARLLLRHLTVEDSTFILNRSVPTALKGTGIAYETSVGQFLRFKANAHNVTAWSDFDQPPTGTAPIPTFVDDGMTVTNANYWYAQDDDVGLPGGFYAAVSTTVPPWYTRTVTEGANSWVDEKTMPIRMDWNGTEFRVQFVDWTPRQSGDSFTNPGPSFIGNPISDFVFAAGRLWFFSGERIVSTRLDDITNLWIRSVVLQTERDPIDTNLRGARFASIDFATTFREAIILLTNGSREVEIRANGPITPQTVQLFDSAAVESVNYCSPAQLGGSLYFLGERDFANIVWEYFYLEQAVANQAFDITNRVHGYIPAASSRITASGSTEQLFIITDADPSMIYVNRSAWQGQNKVMNSWYRWEFQGLDDNSTRTILSMEPVGDFLFILFQHQAGLFLEKMAIGEPTQDTDGTPVQTLGYALRIDRKFKVQGVYDLITDTTSWTVPFKDAFLDEVVLAATWDTADEKAAGTRLSGLAVEVIGDETIITIDGDWTVNEDNDPAPAYVGRSFEAAITLSELFVRDSQGRPVYGNMSLLRGRIRHRDASYYFIEITPPGREALKHEFFVPFIGSTPLDGDQLEPYGEFQFRLLAPSHNTVIRIVNDSPYPAAWIDLDFRVRLNSSAYSSIK